MNLTERHFNMNLTCFVNGVINGVIFNKFKLLHFGNGNLYFPYKLDSVDLIYSECDKILEVLTDSSLSYCNYVYYCVKKASRVCNVILSNMFFVNYKTLVKLFKFTHDLIYIIVLFIHHTAFI